MPYVLCAICVVCQLQGFRTEHTERSPLCCHLLPSSALGDTRLSFFLNVGIRFAKFIDQEGEPSTKGPKGQAPETRQLGAKQEKKGKGTQPGSKGMPAPAIFQSLISSAILRPRATLVIASFWNKRLFRSRQTSQEIRWISDSVPFFLLGGARTMQEPIQSLKLAQLVQVAGASKGRLVSEAVEAQMSTTQGHSTSR